MPGSLVDDDAEKQLGSTDRCTNNCVSSPQHSKIDQDSTRKISSACPQEIPESADEGGWLWETFTYTPQRCRFVSQDPPNFSMKLNFLFALATTITVANLYYSQPILYKIAETFDISNERASSAASLMQAGHAVGLVLLNPLGDVFHRRAYILLLVLITMLLWLVLCLTSSFQLFASISFICGMTTVTPQLMVSLVGDLAQPHKLATSLSIVVSGHTLGMLIARLLSGIIANYTDWRNIYWFAFGAQGVIFLLLYTYLPDYPSTNPEGLRYLRMMWSIVQMLFTEPILVHACLITFITSAVFTSFWTTMSLLLSSPPFSYSSLIIGLFALIGICTILWAPIYSRFVIDKIQPLYSCIIGLTIVIIGVVIGTFIGTFSVAGSAIEAVLIDLGGQACNVANRTALNDINPKARNRINTAYMLAAFIGQLTGTAVGNRLYAQAGWVASGICNIGLLAFALLLCFIRGPREKRWVGYSGGWRIKRDVPCEI